MRIMSCLALLLPILLQFVNIYCMKPLCHSDERSALLQFKQSFVIEPFASSYASSISKVASWNNNNCCMWDGVECDEVSGHVIGLELNSSYLYGSFNSSSSLFYLSHLERLNLADNHFNFSEIPSKISSLSNLVYLNLSLSSFYGQIPMEISNLSALACLDLSQKEKTILDYHFFAWNNDLYLADFGRFIQSLTKLEILDLSYVNMSFPLFEDVFKNLSSLSYFKFRGCNLSGAVPFSLGERTKLEYLDLAVNTLSGRVPSWLENLTELVELDLSMNNFSHGVFLWLGKQTKLERLFLCKLNSVGKIPPCLKNLTNLQVLYLRENELIGQIPTWFSNLTQVFGLDLSVNELHGPIPESITECPSLKFLYLGFNYLNGIVRFEMFTRMKYLTFLIISGNDLRLLTDLSANVSLPKFKLLGLGDCNLRMFPSFFRHQDRLALLQLRGNKIEGHIPNWIGNVRETLVILDLAYNSLSGFENPSVFSLFKSLTFVDLSQNKLQGPLPSFPLSVRSLEISNNSLMGEISPCFCNLRSLVYFNLSNNNLGGIIPQCLGNFSESLAIISLANNHFNGNIPDTFGHDSRLIVVDLSHNQLGGRIPRSLANCKMLESLDLSYNQINDNFPVFFGNLPRLEIMNLRSNHLFGTLQSPTNLSQFSELRIVDVSHNELGGKIPSRFFETFSSMMGFCSDQLTYMQTNITLIDIVVNKWYSYHVIVGNKGMYMNYMKIPNSLAIIDFSSNRFQGDIPESIATLRMIKVLNLSNNDLSGNIPSIFSNLKNLESLDLSSNKLSGEIPQQLTELTFLELFNVSNNSLTGSIPQGKQFDTFENTSYLGNSELCGIPLRKKCGNVKSLVQPHHNKSSKSPIDMSWKSVAIGYGSGIVVGVLLGLVFYKRHEQWVLYTFVKCQKRRSKRTSDRRSR